MELYIEKEFLDNFYLDYSDKPIQKKLKMMFTVYGSKQVYIDYKLDEFENFNENNEIFALISSNDKTPIAVKSIKEHLFSNSNFNQTLVFTNKEMDWFEFAENKGALCFSFDSYQERIREIIDKLHFKIDLSEKFPGWGFLESLNVLNFNNIIISDRYILSDVDNQKITENIIPILNKIICKRERKYNVQIFTKYLKVKVNTPESNKASAKERYQKLNSFFAAYKTKFSIIMNDHPITDSRFHDRYIATNFSLMDSGKGFILVPYKKSDSQIISETIFEYYTYKRHKNLKDLMTNYLQKLTNRDTILFKMYPE